MAASSATLTAASRQVTSPSLQSRGTSSPRGLLSPSARPIKANSKVSRCLMTAAAPSSQLSAAGVATEEDRPSIPSQGGPTSQLGHFSHEHGNSMTFSERSDSSQSLLSGTSRYWQSFVRAAVEARRLPALALDAARGALGRALLDSAEEEMSSWGPSQACGALLLLGATRVQPDPAWQRLYWRISLDTLTLASPSQLSQAAFGLASLGLLPPTDWAQAFRTATLAAAVGAQSGKQALHAESSAAGVAVTSAFADADTALLASLSAQQQLSLPGQGGVYNAALDAAAYGVPARAGTVAGMAEVLLTPVHHSMRGLKGLIRPVRDAFAAASSALTVGREASELVTVLHNMLSLQGLAAEGAAVVGSASLDEEEVQYEVLMGRAQRVELIDRAWAGELLEALDPYEAALSPSDLSCLLACAAELRLTPSPAWIASCHARLAQLPWNWAPATRHCVHALVALAEMGPAALPPATWIVPRLHAMQAVLPGLEPAVLCELGMVMPSLGLHALHGVDAASGNLETDMQHMQDWMRAYCAAMLHAAKEGATSTGTEGLANGTINHASLRDVLGATLGVVCSCIDTAVLPVQNSFLDAPELNTWCMDMLYAADAHVPHAPAVQVATAWPLLVAYADILHPMLQPAADTASAQGDSASSSPGVLPSSRTSPPSSPKRTSWSSGGASWAPKAPAWPLDALSSPALAASLAAFSLPSVPSSPSWSSGSLEPEQEDEEACVLSVEGSGVGVDELACALKHVSMRMAERVHATASDAKVEDVLPMLCALISASQHAQHVAANSSGSTSVNSAAARMHSMPGMDDSTSSGGRLPSHAQINAHAAAAWSLISAAAQDGPSHTSSSWHTAAAAAAGGAAPPRLPQGLRSALARSVAVPASVLRSAMAATQSQLPYLHGPELLTLARSIASVAERLSPGARPIPLIPAWRAAFFEAATCRLHELSATAPEGGPGSALDLASSCLRSGTCMAVPEAQAGAWAAALLTAVGPRMDVMNASQLVVVVWVVSCLARKPPPGGQMAVEFEQASMGKLQDMGPNSLAVVLKGLASLGHRPSPAWQEAYFSALQRGLFASRPGGDVPCLDVRMHTQAAAITSSSTLTGLTQGTSASAAAASAATAGVSADVANASSTGHNSIMSCASNGSTSEAAAAAAAASWVPHALPATGASGLSVASLNSLVYALASLDMHPPASTMLVLLDAVRVRLSLLSALDLGVVLAYLTSRSPAPPSEEWLDDFLDALQSRFTHLTGGEVVGVAVMLAALPPSWAPPAAWLDALCDACSARLVLMNSTQLTRLLGSLHALRHRPSQAWLEAYKWAVEQQLPSFSMRELARTVLLMQALNQRPSQEMMHQVYAATTEGLHELESEELSALLCAIYTVSPLMPDARWLAAWADAMRPHAPQLLASSASTLLPPNSSGKTTRGGGGSGGAAAGSHIAQLVTALAFMARSAPGKSAEGLLSLMREFTM